MTIGTTIRRIFDPSTAKAHDQAKAFSAAVNSSTLPTDVREALLERGHLGQSPDDAIQYANAIRSLCTAAIARSGVVDATTKRSAAFIRQNADVEVVRTELMKAIAEADEKIEITTHHPDPSARRDTASALEPASVYRARSKSDT